MKQHLATLFGWRQPRHLPAQIMQVHATLLMDDGSLTSQIVQIPETTPLSEIIRAVAIQLFAEHNISGEVARIAEITLRASAYGAPSTIHAESPALKSVN